MKIVEDTGKSGRIELNIQLDTGALVPVFVADVDTLVHTPKKVRDFLHNELSRRRILTYKDIQGQDGCVSAIVKKAGRLYNISPTDVSAIKRHIINQYKQRR